MQTLWSRVAQTRGTCCCPQCLQTVQGVSRRATASATRSTPKFLTSSTLWYSGIFAAAATYDAAAKKQRREQWDQAISDVKQELARPMDTSRLREDEQPGTETGLPSDTSVIEANEEEDIFKYVEPFQERPQWPTNTGPPLNVDQLPPQSLYASGARKARAASNRWVPKKLERTMLAVDELQLRIFNAIRGPDGRYHEDVTSSISLEYRDKMIQPVDEAVNARQRKREDIRRLRHEDAFLANWCRSHGDVALSRYSEDDAGAFQQTQRELNRSLQELFRLHGRKAISTQSLLAKVLHNLYLSPAPPNLQTWNTLLLGFKQTKMPELTSYTLGAISTIVVRPNEITNIAALDHFREMNRGGQFIRWIELMRGHYGGLMLAHPDTEITDENRITLKEAERCDGSQERKVYRLPYPTPNVFASIIKGVIKFSGFHSALSICEGMGHEGWGLCMSGLAPLLVDCAERGDWDSGLAVWRQIQALKTRSIKRQGRHGFREEVISLESYAAMIKLCTKMRQKSVFQDIWTQANRAHPLNGRLLMEMVQPRRKVPDAPPLEPLVETVEALPEEQALPTGISADANVDGSGREPEMELEVRDAQIETPKHRQEPRTSAHSPRRKTAASASFHTSSTPTHEQLMGWMPASYELDDYERRERPMTLRA